MELGVKSTRTGLILDKSGWIRVASLWLPVTLAVWTVLSTVWFVKSQHSAVLYMDQWGSFNPEAILGNLFGQHNEHRILVPRLFFLVDLLLFHGRNSFLLASILFCQLIHALLFWKILGFSDVITKRQRLALTLVVSIPLFSLVQHENFLWGFQIQFVGVFAAATAAFASVAHLSRISGTGMVGGQTPVGDPKALSWLGLTLACLVVSILMMSNGLLAGPPLLALAFWLRIPRPYLAAILAVFLVSAGVYLHDYHSPSGHSQPLDSLRHIDSVLLYASAYLGSPFAAILTDILRLLGLPHADQGLPGAQIMGAVALVISLALGLIVVRQGPERACRTEAVLLMIMAMVVGTALVTALGRLTFTYAQALSSRYTSPALVFWSAAGLLGYLSAMRSSAGIARAVSLAAVVVPTILAALLAGHQVAVILGFSETRLGRDEAGTAMILGIKNDDTLKNVFPDPSLPWGARDFLRGNGLSMFSEPAAQWYGVPIGDRFDVARASRCRGVFDTVTGILSSDSTGASVQGRVSGWAWDTERSAVPGGIVIANEKGIVVGLALTGYRRPDVQSALSDVTSSKSGWRGFVNGSAGGSLTAYGVLDGGEMVCRLDQDLPAPIPLTNIGGAAGTVAMPTGQVLVNGMWGLDGDDQVNVPRPKLDGPVYGSWVGSDANTGRIALVGLAVPASRRVFIPFATGPAPGGASIVIRDAGGRELLRSQLASPMNWAVLTFELPLGMGSFFDVIAEDAGGGWGQWLAIGQPRVNSN